MARQTNQKEIIMDVLEDMNHPTAEELLYKIEKKYGSFSKATLYRNLAQFVEEGKVDKVALSDAVVRYEVAKGFHYHIACEYCGRIDNLVLPEPLAFPDKLLGYNIDSHSLTFYGVCPKCQEKLKEEGYYDEDEEEYYDDEEVDETNDEYDEEYDENEEVEEDSSEDDDE